MASTGSAQQSDNHTWLDVTLDKTANESSVLSHSLDMENIAQFQFYAWGVAGNAVSLLGLVGNILSLFVLCHRKMRTSTSVFLISLAIYDSIVLISLVLFMALPTLKLRVLAPYMRIFPYIQPYGYPLALTAQTCSIYTTVGFTVERYIAVCHPLKAQRFCSISRAQKAVLLIFLLSVIYNIPRTLEYKTVVLVHNATNSTFADYQYTDFGNSHTYRHVYFIYMHITFMLCIPCTVLTVLNFALVRAVRKSSHAEGKQISSKQRTENNLTVMLISVVVVFLICEVPSIFDNSFMATMARSDLHTAPYIKLTCISSLMVITNSAINFYLYCVFGKKFRRVFCQIFCTFCRDDSQRSLSMSHRESVIRASVKTGTSHVALWTKKKGPSDGLVLHERRSHLSTNRNSEDGSNDRQRVQGRKSVTRLVNGKTRQYTQIKNDTGSSG